MNTKILGIKGETLAIAEEWKDSLSKATSVEADDKTWSISIEKA